MPTMRKGNLLVSILLSIEASCPVSTQLLPDSQALVLNELEHLYLDNPGPNSIKSTITPCTNYVDSTTGLNNNTLGRQSTAQWIRTAFRKTKLVSILLPMTGHYTYEGPFCVVQKPCVALSCYSAGLRVVLFKFSLPAASRYDA